MDLTEEDLTLFNDKLVLDVGVGSGASSRLWSPRAKEFHGVDIGDGIYRAKNTLKNDRINRVIEEWNNAPNLEYITQDEMYERIT